MPVPSNVRRLAFFTDRRNRDFLPQGRILLAPFDFDFIFARLQTDPERMGGDGRMPLDRFGHRNPLFRIRPRRSTVVGRFDEMPLIVSIPQIDSGSRWQTGTIVENPADEFDRGRRI